MLRSNMHRSAGGLGCTDSGPQITSFKDIMLMLALAIVA